MPILGCDVKTGARVQLTPDARRQGVYVIGTTGTGKTTLLNSIVQQDMADPSRPGLCVIESHGDMVDEDSTLVPASRRDDVILFAPGDADQFERPMGLNVLDCDRSDPRQVRRVTSTVIDTLRKLFAYSWGPRMEDLLRHSILTLMETPDTTLLDLLLILASPEHRERYTANVKDPVLRHFWEVQFASYDRRTLVEVVGSSLNKIGRFLADPLIRRVVAQPRNAFDMRRIMDEGKILLVNLSKGDLGEDNSALLGSVLVNLVLTAALTRRDTPPEKRRPFHLIVDEYQSFATESFPTLQSEARKYAIDVIVAHQYRDQLDDLNKGSTLNVANLIVLRVSGIDSLELASQYDNTPPAPDKAMQPLFRSYDGIGLVTEPLFVQHLSPDRMGTVFREVELPRRLYTDVLTEHANQLARLENYHAACRLIERGKLIEHTVTLSQPKGKPNTDTAAYIRKQSLKLGKLRKEVDALIEERIGPNLQFDVIPAFEPI